ncbi:GNAT family N-acetyltransferase [Bacillus sp. JJ722]|uniref:GNAT family N-acetyltransferase n=1 Tax=Bacillus sp. JJ722 TaxID=3122973 RepID=UPI002FFD8D56
MRNAENEALLLNHKVLQPEHLLIAYFHENTGVYGEISLMTKLDKASLRNLIKNKDKSKNHCTVKFDLFKIAVTEEIIQIFKTAIYYMERYNQVYLNEGHLLKALLKTSVMENILSEEEKQIILTLGTTSRDMITHLGNYTFPKINLLPVRKVNKNDESNLVYFVKSNFSAEWSHTIREAFLLNEPSIYIAFDNKENIIGFAAFDVYKNKKCYFGPMGVSKSNRTKGIGYALLHHCLKDMNEIGYEYVIIGGAGPIEFYESACNAVVIPSS